MIEQIDIEQTRTLDDYASIAHLSSIVQNLRTEARQLVPALKGRTVWMVNSTAKGGGVAEMMPMVVSMLRELGVDTQWIVMGTERQEFFPLTKQTPQPHSRPRAPGDGERRQGALRQGEPGERRPLPRPAQGRGHPGDPRPAAAGNGRPHRLGNGNEGDLALSHRARRHHPGDEDGLGFPPPLRAAVQPRHLLHPRVHPRLPRRLLLDHPPGPRPSQPQEP